jgi:pteridine reductase
MALHGKVALVTGSARRLGREISFALASAGYALALHYRRSASEARILRRQIREKDVAADIFQANLEFSSEIDQLIAEVLNRYGRIDVLVNNAAVFYRTPWEEIRESDWDLFMNVNLKAPFLLSQAASRAMHSRGWGKIIHIADEGGQRIWSGYIPYSVSKAGLIALTRGMARTLAPQIQVNAVAPSMVLPDEDTTDQQLESMVQATPTGRLGAPADVASAILYFVEGGQAITGQVIAIDGGRSTFLEE